MLYKILSLTIINQIMNNQNQSKNETGTVTNCRYGNNYLMGYC